MPIRYGEYGVDVYWEYGSTSTATQASNTELFQIQFNLYMLSSQYDPKLIDSRDQFYTCHSQVLTLPRDEIPRKCCCIGCKTVELVRSSIHFVVNHWAEAYKSYDPYLWENMSQESFLFWGKEIFFSWRITMFLYEMPLVAGVKKDIVTKTLDVLATRPKPKFFSDGGIPEGYFINVDIYHESVPCTPSAAAAEATESDMLKEVRLDRCCSICLEDFDKHVIATRLPCSHIFHLHCLLRWLEKDHKCPLCRKTMPVTHTIFEHSYYGKVERKLCAPSSINTFFSHWFPYCGKKRVSIHEGSKDLHIQFTLYTNGVVGLGHYGEPQLLTIPNRHREQLQPAMIRQVLKSMVIPLYEQPAIIAQIFDVIANSNFDECYAFINVEIYEESGVDLSAAPNMNMPRTTKVGIEELERVKLDKSCGICKDDFSDGLLASRFPCLQHIFHTDCIILWLKTDHKCPLCRYPMPKC